MTVLVRITATELHPVPRIPSDAMLVQAACLLAETRFGTLVVDTDPLSEITEHDLVRALADGAQPDQLVCDIERADPLFVSIDTPAKDAARIMLATGRQSLVVVARAQPIGLVTFVDVHSALWGASSWLEAFGLALHPEGGRL
jgi:CBS domain-containing protein